VFENVAFGLREKKVPKDEIKEKVEKMLKMVMLSGFADRRVTSLSGGQQQRVAIARALVNEPKILLLDEPLGALDLKLRKDMQQELKKIQKNTGITFIFVTHDQEEALSMSDTIVVMAEGKIQQIGTPTDIYNEPVNAFVADFIGESNIVKDIQMREECVSLEDSIYMPLVMRNIVDALTHKENISLIRVFKAADDPQSGSLSASGGTEERDEFIVMNIQTHIVQNNLAVECFGDVFQFNNLFHFAQPAFF